MANFKKIIAFLILLAKKKKGGQYCVLWLTQHCSLVNKYMGAHIHLAFTFPDLQTLSPSIL